MGVSKDAIVDEAIVLKAFRFGDYDAIVWLFTAHAGMIKLLVKGGYRKNQVPAVLDPMTQIEVVYREKRGELFAFIEAKVLSNFYSIRRSWDHLLTAGKILLFIQETQDFYKPSYPLYQLLIVYLNYLGTTDNVKSVLCSFYFKVLRYEGLFSESDGCFNCKKNMEEEDQYVTEGMVYCKKCQLPYHTHFTFLEAKQIVQLAMVKKIRFLEEQWISDILLQKIERSIQLQLK